MPDHNDLTEQKITKEGNPSDAEQGIAENNEVTGERNANYVCTEDEIGVTFDYQPANLSEYSVDARSNSTSRTTSRSRQRSRSSRSRRREASTGSPRCGNPWIIPFLSGIFTGLIFLIIGIVFVIYFRQLPNYIGILFILVSIPPFCMAINKYRTSRQRAQMQRRAELRREVIRGMRSEENNANRGGSLPFSDLPPAYINLALDDSQEDARYVNGNATRRYTWTSSVEAVLPSYKDAVKPLKNSKSRKSSMTSELDLPKYEEENTNTNDYHNVDTRQSTPTPVFFISDSIPEHPSTISTGEEVSTDTQNFST